MPFADARVCSGYFCENTRMSGLWGPQSALDLYLQEEGIQTLLFAGVNADQVRSQPLSPQTAQGLALGVADLSYVLIRKVCPGHGYRFVLPRLRHCPRPGRHCHNLP